MAELELIGTQILHREVQRRLKAYIIANELRPGDRLPAEGRIAQQLGVSRNVVREALRAMEAVGLIEVRKGAGAYVAKFDAAQYLDQYTTSLIVDGIGTDAMWDVRRALELTFIVRAAECIGAADLEELDRLIAAMHSAVATGGNSMIPGLRIHRIAYRCLNNPVLDGLLDAFEEYWGRVYERLGDPLSAEQLQLDLDRHCRLVQALHQHDAGAARAALEGELADGPPHRHSDAPRKLRQ